MQEADIFTGNDHVLDVSQSPPEVMPQGLVVLADLFRRIKALAEVHVEIMWFERKQGVDDLTVVGAYTKVLCSGFLEPCSVRKQLVLDGGGSGFVYPHMQVERAQCPGLSQSGV